MNNPHNPKNINPYHPRPRPLNSALVSARLARESMLQQAADNQPLVENMATPAVVSVPVIVSTFVEASAAPVKPDVVSAQPAGVLAVPTSAGIPAPMSLPATVAAPIITRKPLIQALPPVTSGSHSLFEDMSLVGSTAQKLASKTQVCFDLRQSLHMQQVNCNPLANDVLSSLEAIPRILSFYPHHQLIPHVQLWVETAIMCQVVGLDLRSLYNTTDVVYATAMLSQFEQQFKTAAKNNLQTYASSFKKVRTSSEKQVNNLIKGVKKSGKPFRVVPLDLRFLPQTRNGLSYPHPDEYVMMDAKTRFTKNIQTHFNEMYLGGVFKLLSNSQIGTCFRVLMIFDEKLAAENNFTSDDLGKAWVVTLPEGVGGFSINPPVPYQAATHLTVDCDDWQSIANLNEFVESFKALDQHAIVRTRNSGLKSGLIDKSFKR